MKTLSTGIGFAVGMVVATEAFAAEYVSAGSWKTISSRPRSAFPLCDVDRHQCPKFRRGL